ncbi:hypothetical protein [uncultured Porphyromonas sp.]|uniref:hypothetical protein n=1 Tax=uncultured Porphyromonas sp. TaxID=159274 RepID=UPI00260D7EFE|nr:hypothetical protein [uncultured Porphyromonas sp.]
MKSIWTSDVPRYPYEQRGWVRSYGHTPYDLSGGQSRTGIGTALSEAQSPYDRGSVDR